MKQYSQIIVPFKRVTGEPMELDYKFSTEQELKQWASENAAILHAGLLKIVENEDTKDIDFYTFKEIANSSSGVIDVKNYELVKLISLGELEDVEKDIQDLIDQITAIWGVEDPSNIEEDYNSIKKLAEKVAYLNDQMGKLKLLHQTDKALAGYAGDDVIEYLATLKYGSITLLNNALNNFLHTSSPEGSDILTWEDLRNFLTGYKNNKPLKEVIDEITGGTLKFEDTSTVSVERLELKDGTVIKHSVKLGTGVDDTDLNVRNDNQIIVKNGGLFHNIQVKDTGKALRFVVNGSIIHIFEYVDAIKAEYGIDSTTYDQSTESIVIKFKNGEKLVIPFSVIIRDWDVANTDGTGLKLVLTRSVGEGKDMLSGEVVVSPDSNNGIQKRANGLYVSRDSNNITYGNVSVAHQLDVLKAAIGETPADVDAKIEEVKQLVADTKADLQHELADNIAIVNNTISTLEHNVDDKFAAVDQKFKDEKAAHDKDIETVNQAIRDNRSAVDASIAALEEKLTKADADNLAALDNKINVTKSELEQVISANKEEGDKAHADLNEKIEAVANNAATSVSEAVAGLEEKINATNKTVADLSTELQNKITEEAGRIEGLISDTNKAYQEADKQLAEQIETLNTSLTNTADTLRQETEAKVAELKTYVDEGTVVIRGEISALKQETENAVASLRSYVDEATATLRSEMTAMKQELLEAINTAIASNNEAHVQEYHTFVEATEGGE